MNRRSFFKTLAVVAAGFSVLPSATTYARAKWVRKTSSGIWIVNPAWKNAPYEIAWFSTGDVITRQNLSGFIFPLETGHDAIRYPIGPKGAYRIEEAFPVRFDSLSGGKPIPPIIEL